MRGAVRTAAAALVLLGTSLAGCRGTIEPDVQPILLDLIERLTPEGGEVFAFSGLRRDGNGVHASWETETGMDWAGYSAWAQQRMPPGFRSDSGDGSTLVFRRTMEGDAFVLRIEPAGQGLPARIRASFDGYPY
jgi:hypothetical protein